MTEIDTKMYVGLNLFRIWLNVGLLYTLNWAL